MRVMLTAFSTHSRLLFSFASFCSRGCWRRAMALVRGRRTSTRTTTSGIHYLSLLQSTRKTFRQLMAWDLLSFCLVFLLLHGYCIFVFRSFQLCQFCLGLGYGTFRIHLDISTNCTPKLSSYHFTYTCRISIGTPIGEIWNESMATSLGISSPNLDS